MKNLNTRLGRLLTATLLAFATGAFTASAATIKELIESGKIKYSDNATLTYQDGEAILSFTDTLNSGSLTLPSYAKVWLLSVGGGGAGGTINANVTTFGGGGGGGGGFVELKDELFFGGTYKITVGGGGPAIEAQPSASTPGNDGFPSRIAFDGVTITNYTALGGGGGGAESEGRGDGKTLASGGGGSYSGSLASGGKGTTDQGCKGGDGANSKAAGGGGGAGEDGSSSGGTSKSGDGGAGKPSKITLSRAASDDDAIYYAGGGGGGIPSTGSIGDGGKGGGGGGGGGRDGDKTKVQNGTKNLGGGGGGGNQVQAGGAGGDGIVIIRIFEALDGDPEKPKKPAAPFPYRPEGWEIVTNSLAYKTLTYGCATNVGTYTCTVELKDGFKWSDGTKDSVTFDWKIEPQLIDKPADGKTFPYDGTNHVAIENPNPGLKFTDLESNGKTNAVDAGEYHYTVMPKDANYAWKNAEPGEERKSVTVNWSITPKEVDPPAVPDLHYNRGNQVAITEVNEAWTFPDIGSGGLTNATAAGTYHYTVGLKNNNYVWMGAKPGEERKSIQIDWIIKPMQITMPELYTDLAYNNTWQEPFNTDEIIEDAYGFTADSTDLARDANLPGQYYDFTLTLFNTETSTNFVWLIDGDETFDDQTRLWKIAPATNAITSLKLEGWKVPGSPRPGEPNCEALWGKKTALYRYAETIDASEAQWKTELPTEPGTYYVWAHIPAAQNWGAADRKLAFTLWGNPKDLFTDHVTIIITNNSGEAYADYPLTLEFAEDVPPGFSYERASEGALVFIGADDTLLPYEVKEWNIADKSTVTVYLYTLPDGVSTNDLYWHLREGQSAPGRLDPPENPSPEDKSNVKSSFGTVERNGLKVDSWSPAPVMTVPANGVWDADNPPEVKFNDYALKSGAAVSTGYYDIYNPSITNDLATITAATNGSYRAVFHNVSRDGWEPISAEVAFTVVGHTPRSGIAGNKGDSGRVLLMNNDSGGGDASLAIDYQGWYDADASGAKKSDTSTFWQFLGDDAYVDSTYNLKAGTNCVLWTKNYIRRLWHLVDCRHGNTYNTGERAQATGTPAMKETQNYLPWSTTAYPITAHNTRQAQGAQVGQVVMRNIKGAAVYSPVYTNGVGTIYFDAVNGWTEIDDGKGGENYYNLVVEVATETKDGSPLSEETSHSIDEETGGTVFYGNIKEWKPVAMHPVHVKGTVLTPPESATNRLGLAVTTGAHNDEFYRIYVAIQDLPEIDCMKPLRFRIRRDSINTKSATKPDAGAFILLDNIIVSYPAMTANLTTAGRFDPARRGKQTLGWVGSTATPYPSLSDVKLFGQAKAEYRVTDLDPAADPTRFVVAAKMHYRWRYLDQSFLPTDKSWSVVDLNPMDSHFTAMTPLKLPGLSGDVEYWLETRFQAPYYDYTDYSGRAGLKDAFAAIYTEEKTVLTNHLKLAEGERTAALGTDWFFRLRNGTSGFEGLNLVLKGALASTNAMELVSDGMWRALVVIPTNAVGESSFTFAGLRPAAGGDGLEEVPYGNKSGEKTVERIPTNGDADKDGGAVSFTVDHDANYYEFRFSDSFRTWAVSRAEYQNFNRWNDAKKSLFQAGWSETNGVDDVTMVTETLDASRWTPFNGEDDYWNEKFSLVNYKDPGYPKDEVFQSHLTPAKWSAYNLSFVSKNLISKDDYDAVSENKSGIAAKLVGRAAGILEFAKSDCPQGLEKVTARARIGQSLSFDTLNYSAVDMRKKDYTFLSPVYMSNGEGNVNALTTMAAGASVSVFAYYRESRGCYEFRVTRAVADKWLLAALYKWHKVDGVMTATKLREHWFNGSVLWTNKRTAQSATDRFASYMMFISAKSGTNSTEIRAGFSTGDPVSPTIEGFDRVTLSYNGLGYVDTTDPLTSGTYGVAAKDCPAAFTGLRHYDDFQPVVTPATDGSFTGASLTFKEAISDFNDLGDDGWELNGAVEVHTENGHRQVRVQDLSQQLELWLQAKPNGNWQRFGTETVTGYAFTDLTYYLHLTGEWNLRLQTGGANVDVAVSEVRQVQWQAKDGDGDINSGSSKFIYTQGFVLTNRVNKTNDILLQPARGLATKAMSVRAPILHGLGKIAFSYSGVDPNAQILVQIATNKVTASNLIGEGGYNFSVKSVPLGEPEPVGTWLTLTNYTYAQLGPSGSKTIYLGWHDQPEAPVTGVFRVVVPKEVVERAVIVATNATKNVDYGRITVAGMTVTSEPPLSDRCWRGWNLRTIGDEKDGDKRMLLTDITMDNEAGHGLDCALNNSINEVDPKDVEKASSACPAIYSPTLGSASGSSGIGSVTFKARLYTTGDHPETAGGGKVTLYGALGALGSDWKEVGSFTIDKPVFQDFTWTATNHYTAIKFEVSGPATKTKNPVNDRVILDEIVIGERVEPSLGIVYARPFRMNLMDAVPIADILSINEQPLAGENWGVQTQLSLQQLSDEIDIERGFDVFLSYFIGKTPWGYGKWKDDPNAVKRVRLTQVGELTNLVFRSIGDSPDSLVPPVDKGGSIVQFQITVRFFDHQGQFYERTVRPTEWTQPDWFYPIDLNAEAGASSVREDLFSPYTVLDTVSPGRAWINEVNWNDGPPSQNGGVQTVSNQFIEICVPSGVDMDGWYLRATDLNLNKWIMAKFGSDLPAIKTPTLHAVEGFEFVLLESPQTNLDGGIRDAEGNPVESDGVWSINGPSGTADSGTLSFNRPFQFELVRPSGIVEHQFVLGGTNTLSKYSYGYIYDATNLLATLNEKQPSPVRFLAGSDPARQSDGVHLGSVGVIGGTSEADPPPGGDDSWKEGLRFTPGRLNDGQVIPPGWYLPPNGTNSWVTLLVLGDHLFQDIGGETNPVVRLVIPQGRATNVVYTACPWYELATLTVDGVTNAEHKARSGMPWSFEFAPTSQTCVVTAIEGIDVGLEDPRFKLAGSEYRTEVVNWLAKVAPGATADDIQLATFKELRPDDPETPLGLEDMYWLDIPPVPAEGEEGCDRIWWLRGGIVGDIRANQYRRVAHYSAGDIEYFNTQFDIQLYVSNAVTGKAHAPQYLQGHGNVRSDTATGRWTSETFQIVGKLDNGQALNEGYLPFRSFKFNSGSFSGPEAELPFTSTIEILDPFSTESPGYSYGWTSYPRTTPFFFKWTITTNSVPNTVQTLRAMDTYGD